MRAIINGKIITQEGVINGKALVFEDRIIDIIDEEMLGGSFDGELIDAKGNFVSPGFIDIHIHGSGGSDVMDGTIDALENISTTIAENGVTGFLATTMTMPRLDIYRAFEGIRQAMLRRMPGAAVLGAHMEGPFINEKFKGAQNPEHILMPDYEFVRDYLDVVKLITLAPEKDHNHVFLREMKKHREITLSIGHSNATYAQTMEAIKNGISHATHTFNAMTPLNHREPGVVGAIFGSDISCELIADTIHVHPGIFQILKNIKGKDRVVLITDSMRAGCMKDGDYDLGGQRVTVKDKSARLSDGTLAGSVLRFNEAVRNILANTDLKIHEAISMATINPARVIGLSNKKGSLENNKDADITLLGEDFEVIHTIVGGKTVFRK